MTYIKNQMQGENYHTPQKHSPILQIKIKINGSTIQQT